MRTKRSRLLMIAPIAAFSALASASARAEVTKDQCVDANGEGQQQRRVSKLAAARQQFRTCASPACPAIVRDDCTKRLDEVERAQPTVVFDVKDGRGHDLTGVRVSVDGAALTEHLDGRPLQVDPGEHVFTFETGGRPPLTQTLVIREGERDIHERVVVEPVEPAASPSTPVTTSPGADSSSDPTRSRRVAGAILAVGGVGGVGVGAVFGALTLAKIADQNRDCPSSGCPSESYGQASSDHARAETNRVVSIVGFAAGGALLVSGALLYLLSPAPDPVQRAGFVIVPSVGLGAASIRWEGTF